MTAILASPPSLAQIDHTVIGTWLGVGVGVGGIAVGVGIAFWQHRYNRRAAAKLDRAVADLEAAKNKARVAELEVQGLRSSLTSMAKGLRRGRPSNHRPRCGQRQYSPTCCVGGNDDAVGLRVKSRWRGPLASSLSCFRELKVWSAVVSFFI